NRVVERTTASVAITREQVTFRRGQSDILTVAIEYVPTRFIEREVIPADSPVVGHTWLKANKDGSPDKRFKDNVKIPVVQYGTLTLRSSTGSGISTCWLET